VRVDEPQAVNAPRAARRMWCSQSPSTAMLQCHSAAVPQRYSPVMLQCCSLQYCSAAVLQCWSVSVLSCSICCNEAPAARPRMSPVTPSKWCIALANPAHLLIFSSSHLPICADEQMNRRENCSLLLPKNSLVSIFQSIYGTPGIRRKGGTGTGDSQPPSTLS
jgi:hypothetical protein